MEETSEGARRSLGDRGASAVEYGLVLAVFVVAALASLDALYDNTSEFYDESGQGVGAVPTWSVPSTTVIATTTPAPPTTAGPTTTTTAAPPTTAPGVQSFIDQLEDVSLPETGSEWEARARVNIHRDDTDGNVQGAVVTGRFTTADSDVTTAACTTDSNGRCEMGWSNRDSGDSPTLFEVTNVVANPTWNGSPDSISLVQP